MRWARSPPSCPLGRHVGRKYRAAYFFTALKDYTFFFRYDEVQGSFMPFWELYVRFFRMVSFQGLLNTERLGVRV